MTKKSIDLRKLSGDNKKMQYFNSTDISKLSNN